MKTAWILVADEAIARILERPEGGSALVPVETLTDADAHAREAEFRHGPHGRRGAADTGGGHDTVSAADAERHQHAQAFAARVAQRLDRALEGRSFGELHVVAAPRMLGYLRASLSPAVLQRVVTQLDKDVVHESEADLARRLFAPPPG